MVHLDVAALIICTSKNNFASSAFPLVYDYSFAVIVRKTLNERRNAFPVHIFSLLIITALLLLIVISLLSIAIFYAACKIRWNEWLSNDNTKQQTIIEPILLNVIRISSTQQHDVKRETILQQQKWRETIPKSTVERKPKALSVFSKTTSSEIY